MDSAATIRPLAFVDTGGVYADPICVAVATGTPYAAVLAAMHGTGSASDDARLARLWESSGARRAAWGGISSAEAALESAGVVMGPSGALAARGDTTASSAATGGD